MDDNTLKGLLRIIRDGTVDFSNTRDTLTKREAIGSIANSILFYMGTHDMSEKIQWHEIAALVYRMCSHNS